MIIVVVVVAAEWWLPFADVGMDLPLPLACVSLLLVLPKVILPMEFDLWR